MPAAGPHRHIGTITNNQRLNSTRLSPSANDPTDLASLHAARLLFACSLPLSFNEAGLHPLVTTNHALTTVKGEEKEDKMAMSLQQRCTLVVFVALVLDLLAFTMPLPLFPRIVEHYVKQEAVTPSKSILSTTLNLLHRLRPRESAWNANLKSVTETSSKWDVVLLGGLLGSIFSVAQYAVAPIIGKLSDNNGRKTVLLWTMVGNLLSNAVWLISTSFDSFLLSRVIGGLSEGNVQLSIAIMSDVSSATTRAASLAFIGIAFSLCFTLGPPLGAYLATKPLNVTSSVPLNIYALPAAIALVLLITEIVVLVVFLPETRHLSSGKEKKDVAPANGHVTVPRTYAERKQTLKELGRVHFLFLFLFSGCEYSLTFFLYDLLSYSSLQNGKLLGFIGLLSCLLQGGYVRRASKKRGPAPFARSGILACALGIALLGALPSTVAKRGENAPLISYMLYTSATCLAYTSATVVTCLTALASLQCDDVQGEVKGQQLQKGAELGKFRSTGQLGRALGPIIATGCYWTVGPSICYSAAAVLLTAVWVNSKRTLSSEAHLKKE